MDEDKKIKEAIARLIASTRRRKRQLDLITISSDIKFLKKEMGSLQQVAKCVGVSSGMLNQFLKVDKLSTNIKDLIAKREIDSVAAAHNIAKFSEVDQNIIAEAITKRSLNTLDLRYLSPLRKQFPNLSIEVLIQRLLESKNQKISILRFHQDDLRKDITKFREDLASIIGEDNIVDLNCISGLCEVKITKTGERLLRKKAKEQGQTLNEEFKNLLI